MAIHFTGLSNQSNVGKTERTQKDEISKDSLDTNSVKNGGTMSEDTVRLSGTAQTLKDQESKINDMPEVDMDKVEQIKRAIAAGEYKIDSQKLASSMASMDSLF